MVRIEVYICIIKNKTNHKLLFSEKQETLKVTIPIQFPLLTQNICIIRARAIACKAGKSPIESVGFFISPNESLIRGA